MKKKNLTANQRTWLGMITAEGISETKLFHLKGKARDYAMSYRRSLLGAIDAHNEGIAVGSPHDASVKIEMGPFGPKGGHGYRLVTDPLIQVAIRKLEKNEHE